MDNGQRNDNIRTAVLVCTFVGGLAVSYMNTTTQVELLEQRMDNMEGTFQKLNTMSDTLVRLDEKYAGLREDVGRIEDKIKD